MGQDRKDLLVWPALVSIAGASRVEPVRFDEIDDFRCSESDPGPGGTVGGATSRGRDRGARGIFL